MMNMLAANGMTMSERLLDSGVMVIKGMLMVFAVLALLMIVLLCMQKFFTRDKAPAEKKAEDFAPIAVAPAQKADDGELVAVITAAIAMSLAEEQAASGAVLNATAAPAPASNTSFRVVSFRRVSGRTNWNA